MPLQISDVGIDTFVSLRNELTIEPLSATARFVASAQHDCCSFWIKCKRETPDTARDIEAQLLQVLVTRAVQCVYTWTPKLRSEDLQNGHMREELVLNGFRQGIEFSDELRVKVDTPGHGRLWHENHMYCEAYCLAWDALGKIYGRGRWRKRKGVATVQLQNGRLRRVELHRYEAHGIGRRDFKIRTYLDQP